MEPSPSLPTSSFVDPFFAVWNELIGGEDATGTAAMFVLDEGGDLSTTLAATSAQAASRAAFPGGATMASHVAHAAYFLETFESVIMNVHRERDWPGSFQPAVVDEPAWQATKDRFLAVASRIAALIRGNPHWQPEHVRGALVNLAHLAYHLGAIRQMARAVAADGETTA
jgi:hypothetical protein